MLYALLLVMLLCIVFPVFLAKAVWVTTPVGLIVFIILVLLVTRAI